MILAEALRELIAWKDTPKYQRAYQNESMWINARAALADHDAQQHEGPCKAGGPCRFRGYASPELVEAHTAAQQQEPPPQTIGDQFLMLIINLWRDNPNEGIAWMMDRLNEQFPKRLAAQQQEVDSKSRLKRLAVQQQYTCIGRDPLCPCQDGLACHYKDAGKTKAFPIQE
jgi:hypothetical protein